MNTFNKSGRIPSFSPFNQSERPFIWRKGNLKITPFETGQILPDQFFRENIEIVRFPSTRFLDFFKASWETIQLWITRSRERRQLQQMSERDLKDINLTKIETAREANKWFWQE